MRFRRLCLEIFAFRRFFSEPIEIDRFPGAQCKHRNRRGEPFFHFGEILLKASRTRPMCSSGFTFRKIEKIRPALSTTNVLRSVPMYFLPYMLFSIQTPYLFTICF